MDVYDFFRVVDGVVGLGVLLLAWLSRYLSPRRTHLMAEMERVGLYLLLSYTSGSHLLTRLWSHFLRDCGFYCPFTLLLSYFFTLGKWGRIVSELPHLELSLLFFLSLWRYVLGYPDAHFSTSTLACFAGSMLLPLLDPRLSFLPLLSTFRGHFPFSETVSTALVVYSPFPVALLLPDIFDFFLPLPDVTGALDLLSAILNLLAFWR